MCHGLLHAGARMEFRSRKRPTFTPYAGPVMAGGPGVSFHSLLLRIVSIGRKSRGPLLPSQSPFVVVVVVGPMGWPVSAILNPFCVARQAHVPSLWPRVVWCRCLTPL